MEQKFNDNRLDLRALREFCRKEGKVVEYRKAVTFSSITE